MILALAVLSLPVGTLAGTHRAGAGAGGGRADRSTLDGIQVSGEYVLKHYLKMEDGHHHRLTLSAVGDFTLMGGKHQRAGRSVPRPLTQYTCVVGARLTWNALRWAGVFGHGMFGRYWEVQDGVNSWAKAWGFGVDFLPGMLLADQRESFGIRFQLDEYRINAYPSSSPDHKYPQYTFQIIYRIE
jgi:hypothetical protein